MQTKPLTEQKLRQIEAIMERDPMAYSEIEFGLLRHAQSQRKSQRATARWMSRREKELEEWKRRALSAETQLEDIARALHSAGEAANRYLGDWEADRELAWLFGILRGWEECHDEVAAKFHWTPAQQQLLKSYARAINAICQADEGDSTEGKVRS